MVEYKRFCQQRGACEHMGSSANGHEIFTPIKVRAFFDFKFPMW
jgi:hypothetical protein